MNEYKDIMKKAVEGLKQVRAFLAKAEAEAEAVTAAMLEAAALVMASDEAAIVGGMDENGFNHGF